MATGEQVSVSDTVYLRQGSLRTVLMCLIVTVYLWCAILFRIGDGLGKFGPAWWGPVSLAGGLVLAVASQRRSTSLAALATVLGLGAASLHGMWLGGIRTAPYMLAVTVSLVGLLFSMRGVVWATVLCVGSIIAVGYLRWDHVPLSAELTSPALVVSAVGVLSSLSVRNLYQALYWFRDRAMAAQRNEEVLQDRRGQLVRTLKALDEAYGRLEYLNYDLARAREIAEEASLAKQHFAVNVSHELRTPLNVIVAFSETMYLSPESYGGRPLPANYRGDVREIYRSSQHLLHLIDDVLDMAQLDAGRMRMDLEPVALQDVVSEAVDMIRPLVREPEIHLGIEIPAELPPIIMDRNRILQVLLNLLNNARRFTDRGSITVRGALETDVVRVTVADTGIGIPPEEHENMFKEFYQVEGTMQRSRNGTGLGLAISKRFVAMHSGRIWVESDGVPGHGSRFHFVLPVAGVESTDVGPLRVTRRVVGTPTSRGRTVLLLGGDPAVEQMLERHLEDHQVVPVDDVTRVPELIDGLHARAVVLNSAKEGRVGQLTQQLHQALDGSAIPLVLCPLVEARQLGQSLGVIDYLVKPITRKALVAVLDRVGGDVERVLIVDDDAQMARVFSRLLRADSQQVDIVYAQNGQEGMDAMRARAPDLVLLDLVMPGLDGYGVLEQMQDDPRLREIPVAVITAQTRTPDEERRLGGGMLCVSSGVGFTNSEVLTYLQSILDAVGAQ